MAKGESYDEFVEKFKPKRTTDDCFTPPLVYEAVKDWAAKEFGWQGREIVRPFYPGGDYERFKYPKGAVVIDNPPFSCISAIAKFYSDKGVDYMLFAPHLTLLDIRAARSHIGVGVTITYANGARVNTSFIASEGDTIRSSPSLYRAVKEADELNQKTWKKKLPKYEYPPEVMTATKLYAYSRGGYDFRESRCEFIRELDEQKKEKKEVFGGGYIIPPAPPAPLDDVMVWRLSEREKRIVEKLTAEQLM